MKIFKKRWDLHNKCALLRRVLRCHFLKSGIDYSDETAVALNHMFGDALLAANGHLGLSSRVDDPGRYVHLTDTILHQIRQSTNEVGLLVLSWDPGFCILMWKRIGTCGFPGTAPSHGYARSLLVCWDMGTQISEATQRLERFCHPTYYFNHRQ